MRQDVPATVFSAMARKEEYSDMVQFIKLGSTIALVDGKLTDFERLPEQEFNNVN